jgi:hypothetical protein
MRWEWAGIAAGLLAVAACSSSSGPPSSANGDRHVLTAERVGDHRDQHAELDLVSSAATVTIMCARLGTHLLRAFTPPNSRVVPDLVRKGTVKLFLDGSGRSGPAALTVLLSARLSWRIVDSGGASQVSVDLRTCHLAGADFAAGVDLLTMRLPTPDGTVRLVIAGGASQVKVSVPAGVAARLRLDGGASSVTLGPRSFTGIAGGTVLTTPGWADAASRYDIDAPAGISAISVTRP